MRRSSSASLCTSIAPSGSTSPRCGSSTLAIKCESKGAAGTVPASLPGAAPAVLLPAAGAASSAVLDDAAADAGLGSVGLVAGFGEDVVLVAAALAVVLLPPY